MQAKSDETSINIILSVAFYYFLILPFNMVSGFVGINVLLLLLLLKRIDNHRVCLRTYLIESFRWWQYLLNSFQTVMSRPLYRRNKPVRKKICQRKTVSVPLMNRFKACFLLWVYLILLLIIDLNKCIRFIIYHCYNCSLFHFFLFIFVVLNHMINFFIVFHWRASCIVNLGFWTSFSICRRCWSSNWSSKKTFSRNSRRTKCWSLRKGTPLFILKITKIHNSTFNPDSSIECMNWLKLLEKN